MREQDKQMLADHYLDLYRMAYNVLRNETDTEDAVQEALAITMSHSFLAKPYSYCVRTLYNQCYRLLSKRDYILPDELPDVAQEDPVWLRFWTYIMSMVLHKHKLHKDRAYPSHW